jgi:hypothetical protein
VHAAGDHEAAGDIFEQSGFDTSADMLRRRLEWLRSVATGCVDVVSDTPFGLRAIKAWALRVFGLELRATRALALVPGRALDLLPPAELPEDMRWAESNPRVAAAVARWVATVDQEGAKAVPPEARRAVLDVLGRWNGEEMPLDGRWIDDDIRGLDGPAASIAKLAVVLAKAPYRVTEKMVEDVLGEERDAARFVRILAWSSAVAARRFATLVAHRATQTTGRSTEAAAA